MSYALGQTISGTPKPEAVAENIVHIARQIENESNPNVIISELVTGNDKERLKEAVQVVNKRLKKFCRQNGGNLIEHKDLNNSRLHLNEEGNNNNLSTVYKIVLTDLLQTKVKAITTQVIQ